MDTKKIAVRVGGMSCASCVSRVEKAAGGLRGVIAAKASLGGGKLELEYDEARFDRAALAPALEAEGYSLAAEAGNHGGRGEKAWPLGIGLLLAAAYLLASSAGFFNAFPAIESGLGYGMLFVAGLLTSIHCVAMCGGLAISQSLGRGSGRPGSRGAEVPASEAASPAATSRAALAPGLLYNAGRVLSYTLVGALVGAIGSVLDFSPAAQGLITGLAGLFMVIMGFGMLGFLPPLPAVLRARPGQGGAVSRLVRSRGPLFVGLLNGLMPCGPLQTMQLYALGTGSAVGGALSMFVFSVGTVPLMLGFGLVASLLPRRLAPSLARASAVLVLVLGAATMGRAAGLAGIALPRLAAAPTVTVPVAVPASREALAIPVQAKGEIRAVVEKGVQVVITEIGPNSYLPFVVQAGLPLRWIIRVKRENLNGCNRTIVVPAWKFRKTLVPGDNIVELGAGIVGLAGRDGSARELPYSCWMGMIRSRITVVPDLAAAEAPRS